MLNTQKLSVMRDQCLANVKREPSKYYYPKMKTPYLQFIERAIKFSKKSPFDTIPDLVIAGQNAQRSVGCLLDGAIIPKSYNQAVVTALNELHKAMFTVDEAHLKSLFEWSNECKDDFKVSYQKELIKQFLYVCGACDKWGYEADECLEFVSTLEGVEVVTCRQYAIPADIVMAITAYVETHVPIPQRVPSKEDTRLVRAYAVLKNKVKKVKKDYPYNFYVLAICLEQGLKSIMKIPNGANEHIPALLADLSEWIDEEESSIW